MVVLGYIVQLGEHPVFAIDTALSQMELLLHLLGKSKKFYQGYTEGGGFMKRIVAAMLLTHW